MTHMCDGGECAWLTCVMGVSAHGSHDYMSDILIRAGPVLTRYAGHTVTRVRTNEYRTVCS